MGFGPKGRKGECKMRKNKNSLTVSAAVLAAVCLLCIAQSALAGSIIGWGLMAFDSNDFPLKGVTAIAAGSGHSLALKSDSSIVAWGRNYEGQCNIPSPNTGFLAISAASGHNLGLKQDGSIVAWGENYYGQCNIPSPNSGFIAIAAGGYHSLGLKADGSIVAWGAGQPGQSGRPHYGQCNIPSPNSGFIAISAGYYHSLGLKQDGSIVAWGNNWYGQCNIPSPNSGFIAIAAGYYHSLGLKQDGSIVAWGRNEYGQCNIPSPNSGFVAIAAGGSHSLGLKQDGSIVGWGDNWAGQATPPAGSNFVAIAADGAHSLGLKQDGSIVAWGANDDGECNVPSPNSDFVAIAVGADHSLGLKQDGSIVAWGANGYWDGGSIPLQWFYTGQCDVPSPNSGFIAIAAGYEHSLGLKQDGSIVGWGSNEDEYGNWLGQATPPAGNDFVAISAAGWHSLALKSDGSIVAWGANGYWFCEPGTMTCYWIYTGECDVPSPNSGFIAIAAGGEHSLGLKQDGSIVAWGANRYWMCTWPGACDWIYTGQCDVPSPNTGFIGIAAGGDHSLGLKQDGSIVAWGSNEDVWGNWIGQATPPEGTDFVAIAAGNSYSLAIRETGPGELTLIKPNGGEKLIAGRIYTIEWQSSGSINQVLIEYSDSNGVSWTAVAPANAGNNRRYNWLVPTVNSQECLVRISDASEPGVSDVSDAVFTIYQCTLNFDVTGDCIVDMRDFASLACEWLQCGNPFDPSCAE